MDEAVYAAQRRSMELVPYAASRQGSPVTLPLGDASILPIVSITLLETAKARLSLTDRLELFNA